MSEELNLDGMSSGSGRKITRFKITEGSHIFRVLPPFGTNHNNIPSRQIQLHWGFTKKDGSQSPLPCSYPNEGYCPICERVKEREALAERAKAQGNQEEATEILKDAGRIKVRRSYLLNAANKQGEVGMLELTKTSLDGLIKLMKEYQNKYGKNPVSLNTGVWFVFSREGKAFNTRYEVAFNKTMLEVDGDKVEKVDNSALAENIKENFEKLAYDIHKMYPAVAASDLKRILEGAAVDEVIVRQQKQQETPKAEPKQEVKAAPAAAKPAVAAKPAAAPKAAAAKPAPTPAPAPEEDVDDIMAMLNSDE